MTPNTLPIGSFVRIEKPAMQAIVDQLQQLGYHTVGPRITDGAIVHAELDSVDQLPAGYLDEQDGGHYRLRRDDQAGWFDYVVGPQSLKNYLFPPRDAVLEGKRIDGKWQLRVPEFSEPPLAVIGVRACDLKAMEIQDRVFLKGEYVDSAYQARREKLFLLAINCRRAAPTCFCHSMKSGPRIKRGYDLGLTELDDCFVMEIGTQRGGEVASVSEWTPCSLDMLHLADAQIQQLKQSMQRRTREPVEGENGSVRERYLNTEDIDELLMTNLEHARWEEVAKRCLACANCTMVCPTCFCSSVDDITDLMGDEVIRQRTWTSCFTSEHSRMHSGPVRHSTKARYRQWLTHKLATWREQFNSSGCVGCGRCITWCPVGIDLTEEVAAIRGDEQ